MRSPVPALVVFRARTDMSHEKSIILLEEEVEGSTYAPWLETLRGSATNLSLSEFSTNHSSSFS